jgi:hypothetical protein
MSDTDVAKLRAALADARQTILAHYFGAAFHPRTRPSVVRGQIREIERLLGNAPPNFDDLAGEWAPTRTRNRDGAA